MELAIAFVGGITLFNLMNSREGFQETYYESESYSKQNPNEVERGKVNRFSPSEWAKRPLPEKQPPDLLSEGKETQAEWAQRNSIYNNNTIRE